MKEKLCGVCRSVNCCGAQTLTMEHVEAKMVSSWLEEVMNGSSAKVAPCILKNTLLEMVQSILKTHTEKKWIPEKHRSCPKKTPNYNQKLREPTKFTYRRDSFLNQKRTKIDHFQLQMLVVIWPRWVPSCNLAHLVVIWPSWL